MNTVHASRKVTPETDHPDWAAWYAATRLVDVEYLGKMEALVFRFGNGRIFGLAVQQLQELDSSPVTRISLLYDGDVALIEQFSGNRLEVPWDRVLHLADPTYEHRDPPAGSAEWLERRDLDRAIGERVRAERKKRNLTLAAVSSRTGIKVPNLSRLESGKHTPSLDTLDRVATALDVPVAVLVAHAPGRPAVLQGE